MREFLPRPTEGKTASIPWELLNPHYSDRRFLAVTGGVTIFLAPNVHTTVERFGINLVKGASYVYSDRLAQGFDQNKYQEASEKAKQTAGNRDSAKYFEDLLRELYDKPNLEVVHILAGVNRGNGYPYNIFGYIIPSEEQPTH